MGANNSSCENGENDKSKDDISEFLQNCVKNIAKKEGFITYDLKSTNISTDGGNYMAQLYTIDVKGKTSDDDKEVNLFVKNIISVDESFDSFISPTNAYITEAFVYKDLAKVFKELEDKAGIPVEERYKMVKVYDESSSKAIILENITVKGFKTCDRRKIGPLKFVELSVKQLAKFHALGFAINQILPEFFQQKISRLEYPLKFNEDAANCYKYISKPSMKNLREDLKKKAEDFVQSAPKKYEQYMRDTTTIRTICHGDFRNLNIVMKEEEGEVIEIIPLDFQTVYYGCPANDLLNFLYWCTDRQFRRQHMENVVDLYYDSLKEYLKYFNIDVADVYPRCKFDEAMKDRADFGLIIALGFYPFTFAPESMVTTDISLDPEIVSRIEEIMEDLVDLKLL